MMRDITIVIPAFNEAEGIRPTIERLQGVAHAQGWNMEILVVDDGSTDGTGQVARAAGAAVIRNPVNGGYGLSLRRGIREAQHETIAIIDADGTYPADALPTLCTLMDEGLDMAVGARHGRAYRQSWLKHPARILFRAIAEFVAGRRIPDINSGLRVMRRSVLLPYLDQTCMGFSFTTSITLIFLLNGRFVAYHPIAYAPRMGTSKVRHLRDTLRTGQIMTSIIAAHNPIKLAVLIDAALLVVLLGALAVLIVSRGSVTGTVAAVIAGGFLAAMPVVFMLGCLGELLRTRPDGSRHEPS